MRRLERAIETTVATILACISVLVLFQVIARYGFGRPPSWTEELARYLQVWLVMLAAPVCLRRGMHLAIDYLSPKLAGHPLAHRALRTVVLSLVGLFAVVLTVYGVKLLPVASIQRSPALGISMLWAYLAIPLSGALMTVEAARSMFARAESPGDRPG